MCSIIDHPHAHDLQWSIKNKAFKHTCNGEYLYCMLFPRVQPCNRDLSPEVVQQSIQGIKEEHIKGKKHNSNLYACSCISYIFKPPLICVKPLAP